MTEHRFKIGHLVYFHPKKSRLVAGVPSGPYQITRRLPAVDGEFQYAIKSAYEDHERVAMESELTRV
jgi:hypothetical protein